MFDTEATGLRVFELAGMVDANRYEDNFNFLFRVAMFVCGLKFVHSGHFGVVSVFTAGSELYVGINPPDGLFLPIKYTVFFRQEGGKTNGTCVPWVFLQQGAKG